MKYAENHDWNGVKQEIQVKKIDKNVVRSHTSIFDCSYLM